MLSLHVLQISLVYINTLMLQQVLDEPTWSEQLKDELGALTPLIYHHVNPYGIFRLNLSERIALKNTEGSEEVAG